MKYKDMWLKVTTKTFFKLSNLPMDPKNDALYTKHKLHTTQGQNTVTLTTKLTICCLITIETKVLIHLILNNKLEISPARLTTTKLQDMVEFK